MSSVLRIAGLLAGREPGRVQRIGERAVAGLQRARIAAISVAACGARFGAPEIRQHVGITPARSAFRFPAIEVLRVAAHVHEAVDRGGAAQALAARRVDPAPAEMRFRFRVVEPVVLLHAHRDRERRGHLDEDRAVRAAVLEQQHAVLAVLGEPVGQHAAGGAGADDHEIEGLSRGHRCRPSRHTRS